MGNNSAGSCIACGRAILPGAPVWQVRTTLDPAPRRGFACSEPCARRAENESKMRAYLAIDLLNKDRR